ncbi:MAG: type 4a pilus biogenesis protein PilO [Planctomycetota bacterium]
MRIEKDQWIVAGVIASLTLAFVFAVWLPENRKTARYQERIDAAQKTLGPNFNQPAALAARMEEVDELQDKVESSDRFISAEPELAKLLRSLTEAARGQAIGDQQFNTQPSRHFKHYSEIPVGLEMRSSFDAAYGLLEAIETMPRVVRLDALSLRLIDQDSAKTKPQMQANFRLSGFYTDRQEGGS